jgi:hypothetical protein
VNDVHCRRPKKETTTRKRRIEKKTRGIKEKTIRIASSRN